MWKRHCARLDCINSKLDMFNLLGNLAIISRETYLLAMVEIDAEYDVALNRWNELRREFNE